APCPRGGKQSTPRETTNKYSVSRRLHLKGLDHGFGAEQISWCQFGGSGMDDESSRAISDWSQIPSGRQLIKSSHPHYNTANAATGFYAQRTRSCKHSRN